MAGWVVEVTGLRQVMDALTEVDKKAARAITKEITDAGKAVASSAAAMISGQPVSNWGSWTESRRSRDLSFDVGRVAAGFKVSKNNYRRRGVSAGIGWDVYQKDAAGAIFEVMGDGSRVTTKQGAHLVDTIVNRFPGKPPRILTPAYYKGMPPDLQDKVRDQILAAAREAGLV